MDVEGRYDLYMTTSKGQLLMIARNISAPLAKKLALGIEQNTRRKTRLVPGSSGHPTSSQLGTRSTYQQEGAGENGS